MTKRKEKVCTCTWMERVTKVTGLTINNTAKEPRLGPTAPSMKESMSQERKRASACFVGKTSQATWDSSITITSTGKGPTLGATGVNTWATGNATKCMEAEFSPGETAVSIPENTETIKSTGTVSSSGPTGATTRENGKTENKMARASILPCRVLKKWANGATASALGGSDPITETECATHL